MSINFPAAPKHPVKNFEHLIGQVPGMSEKQLRAHLGLYEGYVKKINEIEEKLVSADRGAPNYSYSEYSELKRRQSVPFNGAYLHELFFENLGKGGEAPSGDLAKLLERDFGSIQNWWTDAKAALSSSYGWVLLCRSRVDGRLRNDLLEEHHRGVMAGQDILLALDGWEHAYMIDYGTSKAEYLKILESAIDWEVAASRLDIAARSASPAQTAA